MSTRIESIILRARDTLADPAKERYSDDRLLRLLSEGQQDIVKQTNLLRNTVRIPLLPNVSEYSLPEDAWIVTRAAFNGARLSMLTFDDMDAENNIFNDADWEYTTGATPLALVYDKLNTQRIKVYPIPSDANIYNTYLFDENNFGIVTDITDYTFDSIYGIITEITSEADTINFSSLYGLVSYLEESDVAINVQYLALAAEIVSVNDTLILSPLMDAALRYYVISSAFRDDLDTESTNKANEFYNFYLREIAVGKKTSFINNTQNNYRSTKYVGPF